MSEMSLSQAIRLGAMLSAQCKGGVSRPGLRCALGAAADAIGIKHCAIGQGDLLVPYPDLSDRFPVLESQATHPVYLEPCRVMGIIWSLNDTHKWTREQIADFVETIEQARAVPAVAAPVEAPQGVQVREKALV